MARLLARALFFLLALPLVASAGALDDYYLSQFDRKADLTKALMTVAGLESPLPERCRTHLYRSLKRDFKGLEPSTQKVLAKYISRPILSGQVSEDSAPSYHLPEGHFAIHYTATGSDAPADLASNDGDDVPDWVQRVAEVFEEVYNQEVVAFGYRPPPFLVRYDVYLRDLASQSAYGYTSDDGVPAYPEVSVSSFIEIDKDFSAPLLTENGKYNPNQLLQITAAHEFHHAIQFGYNYYFDIWYGEVTATWMEDQVYDEVNQLYSYLPKYIPLAGAISLNGPLGGNSEYGRWIFNRHLTQRHDAGAVHAVWEKLSTLHPTTSPTTGTGDIQVAPVIDSVLATSYGSTLGADFLGLAKRIYARDWTTHTSEIGLIPQHKVSASYSAYPVTSASAPAPSVTLPRYTFVFYRFVPSADLADLTVTVSKSSGIQTVLFKKAGGQIVEVPPQAGGASYLVPGFGALDPAADEVVLLVANTTDVNDKQANFSTDATVPPVASGSGGGGGGGCFIATAAYGSYLHPKVAELREFRDHYLLTNAPGRLLVSLYYRVSPPVAELIGEHEWMRGGVRFLLVPVLLAVEHPGGALVLLLVGVGGMASRRVRRSLVPKLQLGNPGRR